VNKLKFAALLFGAALIAVLAAGCGSSGGDDSTSSVSEGSLTKAEFIKQGDEICEKGNQKINDEAENFASEEGVDKGEPKQEQQEEAIEQIVAPGVREQAEEIAALGAPKGDQAEVEAIVAAVKTGAAELEEDPEALLEGKNPLSKGSQLAAKYGFKECGEEG
jgi:hypothetical protein